MSDGIGDLVQIIQRCDKDKPTKEDKAALSQALQTHPAMWRAAGDLAEQAARKLAAGITATHAVRRSMLAGYEQLQRDLLRPSDGELDRLLVQQVALSWLKLSLTEYEHAHYMLDSAQPIKRLEFWERRLSSAQRRYLRATETLSRVRRLQLPAVQVNIAEQQVNQVNTRG